MKQRVVLLIALFMSFTFAVQAQNRGGRSHFDFEKMKKEKAAFLTKELDLTEEEAKAFLPLEMEFMVKKFEINRETRRETRELKQKADKTDADYERIVKLNLQLEQKETDLQVEYYKKFAEVLPASKIEKYRIADLKFKEELLRNHQQHRRGQR